MKFIARPSALAGKAAATNENLNHPFRFESKGCLEIQLGALGEVLLAGPLGAKGGGGGTGAAPGSGGRGLRCGGGARALLSPQPSRPGFDLKER